MISTKNDVPKKRDEKRVQKTKNEFLARFRDIDIHNPGKKVKNINIVDVYIYCIYI